LNNTCRLKSSDKGILVGLEANTCHFKILQFQVAKVRERMISQLKAKGELLVGSECDA
tara:strand:+ start:889 stop:1062 length:174 start_codon:yes stop_codon:yes gene_type:complete